jgi:hypothetical protein
MTDPILDFFCADPSLAMKGAISPFLPDNWMTILGF